MGIESRSISIRVSNEVYNDLVAMQKRLSLYATAAMLKAGASGGNLIVPALGTVVNVAVRMANQQLDKFDKRG